jgi:hypothetical protein
LNDGTAVGSGNRDNLDRVGIPKDGSGNRAADINIHAKVVSGIIEIAKSKQVCSTGTYDLAAIFHPLKYCPTDETFGFVGFGCRFRTRCEHH